MCVCMFSTPFMQMKARNFSLERENPNFDGVEKQVANSEEMQRKNREEGKTLVAALVLFCL